MKPTRPSARRQVHVCLAIVLVAACSSDRPDAASATGGLPPIGATCATPDEGCPCPTPGEIVPCGKVSHVGPDGYVSCQMGGRTCIGERWGSCIGEGDVRSRSIVI